jgi:hypothetical protein
LRVRTRGALSGEEDDADDEAGIEAKMLRESGSLGRGGALDGARQPAVAHSAQSAQIGRGSARRRSTADSIHPRAALAFIDAK